MFFSGDIFLFSSFIPLFWELLISSGAHEVKGEFKRHLVQPPGVYDEEAEAWPGEGLCEASPSWVSISQVGPASGSPTPARGLSFLHVARGDPLHMMTIFPFLRVRTKHTIFQCSLPLAPFAVFPASVCKSEALGPVG